MPITHIVIPRIALSADVVVAELVETDGGETWQVPAFNVGHAEGTAGAGEIGNALLFGHVTSRTMGNVFRDLHLARIDDEILVFSGSHRLAYQVVEIRTVGRTDVEVLDPTPSPSISLITCTGLWNPVLWDYMERLVVRAELIDPSVTAHSAAPPASKP